MTCKQSINPRLSKTESRRAYVERLAQGGVLDLGQHRAPVVGGVVVRDGALRERARGRAQGGCEEGEAEGAEGVHGSTGPGASATVILAGLAGSPL